jgi:carbon monoxide dehydrogenase subunit G
MKLNGTHKFHAPIQRVYNALLSPEILKSVIPGCEQLAYIDANNMQAMVTTPLPGLKGPFAVTINIAQHQEPNLIALTVLRSGRGGAINAQSQINLLEEADGTLLSYNANADLEGAIAAANNPIGQGIVKNSLGHLFKNLEKAIA